MAFGRLDAAYLVSGYLNGEDNAYQGGSQGLAGVPGQLGMVYEVTQAQALALSNTSTGTCYGGLYQWVQVLASASNTPARGTLVFWNAPGTNYVVTTDATAATEANFAGVLLNTVTKGNYTLIQIGGLASVQFRASVTSNVAGDIVLQLTTTNTADAIADATGTYISGGVKGLKNIIGSAVAAPANGAISTVQLKNVCLNL